MNTIILLFAITLVNVVLNTIKSIVTIKSTRLVAAAVNAVTYGFYAMVVKQMVSVDLVWVVTANVVCNFVGVMFSMWLMDKIKTETLWKITAIPELEHLENIKTELINHNVGYVAYEVVTKYGNRIALDIFSYSQKDSHNVREVLNNHGKVKYHIAQVAYEL